MEQSLYYRTRVLQRPDGIKDWVRIFATYISQSTIISVATAQLGSAPARLSILSHIYSSLLISRAYKYDSKWLMSGSERLEWLFLAKKGNMVFHASRRARRAHLAAVWHHPCHPHPSIHPDKP